MKMENILRMVIEIKTEIIFQAQNNNWNYSN